MSTERQLGDRWAAKLRAEGYFVQKIPAGSVAGFPDWLVCGPLGPVELVEAKKALSGAFAFRARQLTRAQRWFVDQVCNRHGRVWVLVLAEDGFVMLSGSEPLRLSAEAFNQLKEPYDATNG